MKLGAWIFAALLLQACANHAGIQRDYTSNRDECQSVAENNVSQYLERSGAEDEKSVNAKLVALFSECMFEQGWSVASPVRASSKESSGD